MLNIGKIAAAPTAGLYYVEQVAGGAEDYYASEGERPGRWMGGGGQLLGLAGEVNEDGILRLLDARDPRSNELLRRPLASGAVAGFDLTFRAPKSVSLLFGIAGPEIASEIRAAHDVAVAEALGYMEREACRARRDRGGQTVVPGRGFVAAGFEHRASRAGDPLLHTHVVVANETQGPDGRWTALDGRLLYQHAKTGGFLYQAVLRAEMTERLQVRWHPVDNGTADIVGVPRQVIDHFSQRRAEVLELMAERGDRSARAAQIATLDTRRRKRYDVPIERLREDWRARAAEHGLTRFRVQALFRHRRPRDLERHPLSDVAAELERAGGLTRQRSTFSRREVVQAFAEAASGGTRVRDVEAQADAFLARNSIVQVEPVAGEPRFTTRELLEIESGLLEGAKRRRRFGVGRADPSDLDAALSARPELSGEQRELVTGLTQSGDGVQVVRAAAGTGKTRALDGAREAWQRSGVPVLGCSLSSRAACELRDEAAVDATTIARLTYGFDHGVELTRGSVLIVDEAGMVGTRDLVRLVEAADRANAKLVLVGDDRQLPEIEAGGAFRELAVRLGADELHEVRRQSGEWDRAALAALRDGDVERFALDYHEHGRIVAAPTAEKARAALVQDWWSAYERGEVALMIAHRRTDVADLNRRARDRMRDAGRLGVDEFDAGERSFAVGDRVTTTRNDRRLDVVNGQAGQLIAIADGRLTIELDRGDRVEVPETYARDGHLDHGYATTAHRAQGATVDRAFVLGSDEIYREWGYTALSRHRDEARFYVTASPTFLNIAPDPLRDEDATRRVTAMLSGSRAEHLAMHGVEHDHRLRAMTAELEAATHQLGHCEAALDVLRDERRETHWYQRSRRAELDVAIAGYERAAGFWQRTVDDLVEQIAGRPEPREPELRCARDPLATLEPDKDLALQRARKLELSRDVGIDLDMGW